MQSMNYTGKLAVRKAQGYHIEEIPHPDHGLFAVVFVSMTHLEVHPIRAKWRGKEIGGQSDFKFQHDSYWSQEHMGMTVNGQVPDSKSVGFTTLWGIGNSMRLAACCSGEACHSARKALKLIRARNLQDKIGELQQNIADLQDEINQILKEIE